MDYMVQAPKARLTPKEKALLEEARPILDTINALMVDLAIPSVPTEFVRLILAGSVAMPEQAEAHLRQFREVLDNLVEVRGKKSTKARLPRLSRSLVSACKELSYPLGVDPVLELEQDN